MGSAATDVDLKIFRGCEGQVAYGAVGSLAGAAKTAQMQGGAFWAALAVCARACMCACVRAWEYTYKQTTLGAPISVLRKHAPCGCRSNPAPAACCSAERQADSLPPATAPAAGLECPTHFWTSLLAHPTLPPLPPYNHP
eukprot:1158773-Pelagomonas_calceolata.AAC.10